MNNIKSLFRLVIKRILRLIFRFIKLIGRLNRTQLLVVLGLLVLIIGGVIYKSYFAKSLYHEYNLVSLNTYVVSQNKYTIKIADDGKISGNICGAWQGSYKEEANRIVGSISIEQSTCDQLALSIQYALMYGMQSGLAYNLDNEGLVLTDTARSNVFTLKTIK